MNLKWQEGLKEIKQKMSLPSKGALPRKPRRKRIRDKKQKAPVGMTYQPFADLKGMLNPKNQSELVVKTVTIYAVEEGDTEPVIIQSCYSLNELEQLINHSQLKNLVATIVSYGGGYYQIELVKELLPNGRKAAQRSRLEVLGQIVAYANGLHSWEFEEKEDLGYY